MSQHKVKQAGKNSPGDGQPCVLFRPSTDWMRPTHVKEGNLLYTVYYLDVNPTHIREGNLLYTVYYLDANFVQNTLTETPRIMFEHPVAQPS